MNYADAHSDDCPGVPEQAEVYDIMPPAYGYRCSECHIRVSSYTPPLRKPADLRLRHLEAS